MIHVYLEKKVSIDEKVLIDNKSSWLVKKWKSEGWKK